MKTKTRDLYQEITDKIVAELETGAAPWVKPWRATAGRNTPANAVTGRPYSGTNVLLLWIATSTHGWATPRFLTFKQAKAAGGTVRGGEKSTTICFLKRIVAKDKQTEEERSFGMMRMYNVFNIAQCDNLPARLTEIAEPVARNDDERDVLIEEFIGATKAVIIEGQGEACYRPGVDNISMPTFKSFKSGDHFNSTRFHELTHWTGHKSRLDRDFLNRFGSERYAAEELVAELGSAFLCAEFDIDGDLRHAGYIGNWIKLLKSDPKAIFTASTAAQKAADHLRGLALKDDDDETELEAA